MNEKNQGPDLPSSSDLPGSFFASAGLVTVAVLLILVTHFGGWEIVEEPGIGPIRFSSRLWTLRAAAFAIVGGLCGVWFGFSDRPSRSVLRPLQLLVVLAVAVAGVGSLWLAYPEVVRSTRLEATAATSVFAALCCAVIMGFAMSTASFALVMTRSKKESSRLSLPRVPIPTRNVLALCSVLFFLGAVGAYAAVGRNPIGARFDLTLVTAALTTLVLLNGLRDPFWYFDQAGRRVPFAERIKQLRRTFDSFDASVSRFEYASNAEVASLQQLEPSLKQHAIRRLTAEVGPLEAVSYRCRLLEPLTLEPFPLDGDPYNSSPKNRGLRVALPRSPGKTTVPIEVEGYMPSDGERTRTVYVDLTTLSDVGAEVLQSRGEALFTIPDWRPSGDLSQFASQVLNGGVERTFVTMIGAENPNLMLESAMNGDERGIQWYLDRGGDANLTGQHGWTLLHAAVATGLETLAQTILEAGAKPDIENLAGFTPMAFAIRYGRSDLVSVLIDYGADPNHMTSLGMTPLVMAAETGQREIVEVLLGHGADPRLGRDELGQAPVVIAEQKGHGEIARLLRLASRQRPQ